MSEPAKLVEQILKRLKKLVSEVERRMDMNEEAVAEVEIEKAIRKANKRPRDEVEAEAEAESVPRSGTDSAKSAKVDSDSVPRSGTESAKSTKPATESGAASAPDSKKKKPKVPQVFTCTGFMFHRDDPQPCKNKEVTDPGKPHIMEEIHLTYKGEKKLAKWKVCEPCKKRYLSEKNKGLYDGFIEKITKTKKNNKKE